MESTPLMEDQSANIESGAPTGNGDEWGDGEGAAVAEANAADDAINATSRRTSVSNPAAEADEKKVLTLAKNLCTDWNLVHVLYLSLFTTLGVTLRAFMERFFGGDCESNAAGHPVDDWLWPLSHTICITANGRTAQYGGALFIDLPANMFGSFIMGFWTGHSVELPAMPCCPHDHPVQEQTGLYLGMKTAICGSLTTFSSWNSQMVLMMDGTANPYLHSQVLAAIFGYILGLQASVVSFRAGRTLAAWIHLRRNPHVFDSALSKREMRTRKYHNHMPLITAVVSFLPVGALFGLFLAGDFVWNISFYREMWIACLVAPIGTILRWKLSTLNGKFSFRGLFWFPTGTYLANFIGSILSAGLTALQYIDSKENVGGTWRSPILAAISLGVAGSLSTVSTFVKECCEIGEKYPPFDKKAFGYSHGTMLSCCFVGLLVYSPIVRYL
ncbi:hypothetical protein ACHAWF_004813 [Thalassiosira exigua]